MSLLMRFDECAVRFGFVLNEVVVFCSQNISLKSETLMPLEGSLFLLRAPFTQRIGPKHVG